MINNTFQHYLQQSNLSSNTQKAYLLALRQFEERFSELTKSNLNAYKLFLIENYKPQTVNLRLRAINCYLEMHKKTKLKLSFIKVQQRTFLENVISESDYQYFKQCLKLDNELYWYFVIRFLAATGARISELVQIKCEHIKIGYIDLYAKGGKLRRIYIPNALQKEALDWLRESGRNHGFMFLNKFGQRITTRSIGTQLKLFANRYQIDPKVVYPHSFRHRFAKSFFRTIQ